MASMRPLAVALLVAGCTPAPWAQKYGYYLAGNYPAYPFRASLTTPSGVDVDTSGQDIAGVTETVDASVSEVETCLGKSIDRKAFKVKIPPDWGPNCDKTQQVLPFATDDRMCKGELATKECPCRFRAILQEPNIVVATPNLLLFKDALVRLLTGSNDPWSSASLVDCVTPHVRKVSP